MDDIAGTVFENVARLVTIKIVPAEMVFETDSTSVVPEFKMLDPLIKSKYIDGSAYMYTEPECEFPDTAGLASELLALKK